MHMESIKLKQVVDLYFQAIEGDEDSIMGLPVKKIKEYLKAYGV